MNKVAIITGSTRGIGRQMAIDLAKAGYNITITGKSEKTTENLPGNIYSVSDEIKELGVDSLPYQLDIRDHNKIKNCVEKTYDKWGRIDVLINNAGALWWKNVTDTPYNKYDLINNINSRGSFLMAKECIPYMLSNNFGHIINCSPPLTINNKLAFNKSHFKNKVGYMISKLGMTIGALGIAEEFRKTGVAANTLWPLRPVESYALINNNLGSRENWRKAEILSDSVLNIIEEDPFHFTGHQLIDELYLKEKGVVDFDKYNCIKGSEPPLLNDIHSLWKS